MRIHCDGCGCELESEKAIQRSWDGTIYSFCSDRCARASSHLADDVAADAEDRAVGPQTNGDADEPVPSNRPRRR